MTWVSLICLLALASSAFARSSYGSYSFEEPKARTIIVPTTPVPTGFSGYGSKFEEKNFAGIRTLTPVTLPEFKQPTEAELQCRGKQAGTIILVDNGRRWITCLEEGIATEQACASGLYFNLESGRCERRPGQLENPCASSPCLNNGECVAIDSSSFECRCAAGFDGHLCELDARVCQTQKPCGTAPGTRCQSFRFGAALPYICIHNNEQAYGFNVQQITPSPCNKLDGTHGLGITDKGFLMCDGERMFVESCPGGTIWDNVNKACVWPDMQDFFGSGRTLESNNNYGYSQEKVVRPVVSFSETTTFAPRPLEPVVAYSEATTFAPRPLEPVVSHSETVFPSRPIESFSGYGETSTFRPRVFESYSSVGQNIPKMRTFEPSSSFAQSIPRTFPKVDVRMALPKSGY